MGVKEVSFDVGRWMKLASQYVLGQAFFTNIAKLWCPLPEN
jgi:hypothetical protein